RFMERLDARARHGPRLRSPTRDKTDSRPLRQRGRPFSTAQAAWLDVCAAWAEPAISRASALCASPSLRKEPITSRGPEEGAPLGVRPARMMTTWPEG